METQSSSQVKLPISGQALKLALEQVAKELEWAAGLRGEEWTTYRDRQLGTRRLGKLMPECYRQQILRRAREYRHASSIVSDQSPPSNEGQKEEQRTTEDEVCL